MDNSDILYLYLCGRIAKSVFAAAKIDLSTIDKDKYDYDSIMYVAIRGDYITDEIYDLLCRVTRSKTVDKSFNYAIENDNLSIIRVLMRDPALIIDDSHLLKYGSADAMKLVLPRVAVAEFEIGFDELTTLLGRDDNVIDAMELAVPGVFNRCLRDIEVFNVIGAIHHSNKAANRPNRPSADVVASFFKHAAEWMRKTFNGTYAYKFWQASALWNRVETIDIARALYITGVRLDYRSFFDFTTICDHTASECEIERMYIIMIVEFDVFNKMDAVINFKCPRCRKFYHLLMSSKE